MKGAKNIFHGCNSSHGIATNSRLTARCQVLKVKKTSIKKCTGFSRPLYFTRQYGCTKRDREYLQPKCSNLLKAYTRKPITFNKQHHGKTGSNKKAIAQQVYLCSFFDGSHHLYLYKRFLNRNNFWWYRFGI